MTEIQGAGWCWVVSFTILPWCQNAETPDWQPQHNVDHNVELQVHWDKYAVKVVCAGPWGSQSKWMAVFSLQRWIWCEQNLMTVYHTSASPRGQKKNMQLEESLFLKDILPTSWRPNRLNNIMARSAFPIGIHYAWDGHKMQQGLCYYRLDDCVCASLFISRGEVGPISTPLKIHREPQQS